MPPTIGGACFWFPQIQIRCGRGETPNCTKSHKNNKPAKLCAIQHANNETNTPHKGIKYIHITAVVVLINWFLWFGVRASVGSIPFGVPPRLIRAAYSFLRLRVLFYPPFELIL